MEADVVVVAVETEVPSRESVGAHRIAPTGPRCAANGDTVKHPISQMETRMRENADLAPTARPGPQTVPNGVIFNNWGLFLTTNFFY